MVPSHYQVFAKNLEVIRSEQKMLSYTGGSRLSQIFWEHENLSDLSIIRLIQLL